MTQITATLSTALIPQPALEVEVVTLEVPRDQAEALLSPINDMFLDHGERNDEVGEAVRNFWTAAVNLASTGY